MSRQTLYRLIAPAPTGYALVSWVFLKALALIYLAAFASLALQITALAGEQGIYPLAEQLARAESLYGGLRLIQYPSLFWLWAGDAALLAVAWGGCGLALLLLLGTRLERGLLVALYLSYLSLYHAGQIFTNFQWDYLLLETGFLAIFLPGGSRIVVWLFRWLLFRLRILSGLSKLLSQDTGWSGLDALDHYFETQPLPHAGAWFAHQLPDWVQRIGTGGTLFVELVVPLFMLLPRPWRMAAAWLTILWQLLIIATSNHNFVNLLTIALCLFLFDDRALSRVMPDSLARHGTRTSPFAGAARAGTAVATVLVALVVVPASLTAAAEMIRAAPVPVLSALNQWVEPFRIANRYHVFPTIDRERIAVQIEASLDGEHWVPIDFRYAPDDPRAITGFIVPHQPRVDWALWFVPKGPHFLDWFERFQHGLLAGSPEIKALLAQPPFSDQPPGMLRTRVYRYRFATPDERATRGVWWLREDLGPFFPLPYLAREP
jgi:hypothetical protein